MKVKFLGESDDEIKFILSETDPEFANALRRAIISEVPVMAISKVHYSHNNSALYNEMLALRLGLIPLKADIKTYNLRSECSCKGKGCPKCTATITLDVRGPGMVYARDLKSSDPNVKPVYPDMPIVKLFEGQEVKLEAEAVLGYGTEHARFNAGMASYQYYPKITVRGSSCSEAIKACPKGVLEMKGGKVVVKDLQKCDLCLACVNACNDGKIKVEGDTSKFIFTVESWGQYTPRELVKAAINELIKRTDEFLAKSLK